jgi:ATP-dependent DNA helicase 2 subunit 2
LQGINEAFLKSFTEQCGGIYGTLQEAISELEKPRIKATRPIPSYRGTLSLGNPHMSDSHALSIDVERYPRTYLARAPGASNFVYRSDLTNAEGSTQSAATIGPGDGEATANLSGGNNLTSVKSMRTYQVDDEDAANGKRDVDRDDLAKGYEYGRTAVHISESDENVTKLETTSGLELIGFIPQAKVCISADYVESRCRFLTIMQFERYMDMSVSNIIIAQKANELAGMALSSFVHALEELETYGIARLVTKDDKAPVMVLLAPSLEQDYESLIEVQLPFAEDVRPYKFAPLDRVFTVSGKALKEHRNLPNTDLRKSMDELVDCMDLSTLGMDDEG